VRHFSAALDAEIYFRKMGIKVLADERDSIMKSVQHDELKEKEAKKKKDINSAIGCIIFIVIVVIIAIWLSGDDKPKDLPAIPKEAISMANNTMRQYDEVADSAIVVKGDEISLVVIVKYPVKKSIAMSLGDNFVRLLSSSAASYSDKFTGPTKNNYGNLYNYYGLLVGVYTETEQEIALGAKVTGSPKITW